jgi:hypothetical protein
MSSRSNSSKRPLKSRVGCSRGELIAVGAEGRYAGAIGQCGQGRSESRQYSWPGSRADEFMPKSSFATRSSLPASCTNGDAYPRLKSMMTARDLSAVFIPSSDEILVARRAARSAAAQLGFLVLLKLYQRLGRPSSLAPAGTQLSSTCARRHLHLVKMCLHGVAEPVESTADRHSAPTVPQSSPCPANRAAVAMVAPISSPIWCLSTVPPPPAAVEHAGCPATAAVR